MKDDLTEFFGDLSNEVTISVASEESEKQITELTSEIQTLADEASFNRYNTDKCQQLVNLILRRKPSSDKSPLNSVLAISWGPGDLIAYGTTQGILGFYNSKDNTYEEYAKYTDSAITAIKWKENLVVFGNKSGVVRVWDNKEKLIVKELGVSYPIRASCLMADNFLAVATTKTYSSVNISNVEYRRREILDISSLACFLVSSSTSPSYPNLTKNCFCL